jgi:hypothetical protein
LAAHSLARSLAGWLARSLTRSVVCRFGRAGGPVVGSRGFCRSRASPSDSRVSFALAPITPTQTTTVLDDTVLSHIYTHALARTHTHTSISVRIRALEAYTIRRLGLHIAKRRFSISLSRARARVARRETERNGGERNSARPFAATRHGPTRSACELGNVNHSATLVAGSWKRRPASAVAPPTHSRARSAVSTPRVLESCACDCASIVLATPLARFRPTPTAPAPAPCGTHTQGLPSPVARGDGARARVVHLSVVRRQTPRSYWPWANQHLGRRPFRRPTLPVSGLGRDFPLSFVLSSASRSLLGLHVHRRSHIALLPPLFEHSACFFSRGRRGSRNLAAPARPCREAPREYSRARSAASTT